MAADSRSIILQKALVSSVHLLLQMAATPLRLDIGNAERHPAWHRKHQSILSIYNMKVIFNKHSGTLAAQALLISCLQQLLPSHLPRRIIMRL